MNLSKKNIFCPLSGSSKNILIENIRSSELSLLYKHQLSIDTTLEFGSVQEIGLYHCLDSDLKFFYPSISGTEEFYEQLQGIHWYYLNEKYEYDYVQKFIRPTDYVLEVGCGSGFFAQKLSAGDYCGLEFSQKAQSEAKQQGINVLNESIEVHAGNCPAYYDVVCAFQVLEHVAQIDSFIASCLQCLKPGGLLLYSVPSSDSFLSVVKNNILNMPPHHISWWSDKALEYVAQKFKLEIIDIKHEPLADIHKIPFLASVILEGLSKRFNLKFALINISWNYRFLAKFSEKMATFLVEGLTSPETLPNGHSVIAVYRKSNF